MGYPSPKIPMYPWEHRVGWGHFFDQRRFGIPNAWNLLPRFVHVIRPTGGRTDPAIRSQAISVCHHRAMETAIRPSTAV